jgi:hypothetical protein
MSLTGEQVPRTHTHTHRPDEFDRTSDHPSYLCSFVVLSEAMQLPS